MSERQSFFASDLGASGFYDDTDGVVFNPVHDDSVNKDSETIPKVTPTDLAESGHYASQIGSSYQVDNDLNGSQLSPRTEREPVEENGRNTPESGIYSRNIENVEPGKKQPDITVPGENVCLFKGSWSPENRGSGIYSTRVGSFKDSSGEDIGIRQPVNREENFRMSRKSRPSEKLGATTLSTMTEEDEQPPSDRNQSYLEYSRTENHHRMNEHDNVSNSSRDQNGQPPPWTDMIFNRGFNEAYLQRAWPRISLHLQRDYRAPSDPFVIVPGKKLDTKQQRNYGRYILCSLWWGFVGLSIIVALLVVFLIGKKDDEPAALKEYVQVDMNMTVNRNYTDEYNDPTSEKYKSFSDEFCSEVGIAYKNDANTQSYYGCRVTDLSAGSIVVVFTIYYTDTSESVVTTNFEAVIVTHIQLNANKLGQFNIVNGSVNVKAVITVKLKTSPPVQGTTVQTTTVAGTTTTVTTEKATTSSETSTDVPSTRQTTHDQSSTESNPTTAIANMMTSDEPTKTVSDTTVGVSASSKTVRDATSYDKEPTTTANKATEVTESSTLFVTDQSLTTTEHTTSTTKETSTTSPSVVTENSSSTTEHSTGSSKQYSFTPESRTTHTQMTVIDTEQTTSSMPKSTTDDLTVTAIDTESTTTVVTKYLTESTTSDNISEAQTTETQPPTSSTFTAIPTSLSTFSASTKTEMTQTVTRSTTTISEPPTQVMDMTTTVPEQTTISETTSNSNGLISTTSEDARTPTEQTNDNTILSTKPKMTESTHRTESTTKDVERTSTLADLTSTSTKMTSVTELRSAATDLTSTATEFSSTATDITSVTEITSTASKLTSPSFDVTTLTYETTGVTEMSSTSGIESTTTIENTTAFDFVCESQKTWQLFEGPVNISCSISSPQVYNIIHVYHEGDHTNPNSVFDIRYFQNETVYEEKRQHADIRTDIFDTMITITFENVSCLFQGKFHVALLDYSTEVARSVSIVNIEEVSEKPAITLSPDQVTDLVFPDGNFYRTTSLHTCEGNTGFSLSNWKIDITSDNGTSFVDLSTDQLKIVSRSNVTSRCINYQTVKFAIKFSEIMHKARIRCQNPDDLTSVSLSDELLLVPRNICDCGIDKSTKGHPSNCNSRVICVRDSTGIYPEGVSCDPPSWCRDSISGVCSANCSDSVCNEPVPDNFCTTPAPPTTTPVPSPYVSCNDVTAQLDSGTVEIQCSLNGSSSFSSISIAFRRLGESADTPVATIDSDNTNTITLHKDDLEVSFSDDVITISTNTSCENEGAFWITMLINGSSVPPGYSKFSLKSKPKEAPVLKLHPDQVAGLEDYRSWLLHSCTGDVGLPAGDLSIEIKKESDIDFSPLTVDVVETNDVQSDFCTDRKEIKFGVNFTTNMNNALIRCLVKNGHFVNYSMQYSNTEMVSLIPQEICENNTKDIVYFPHPSNCKSFVQCEKSETYGLPCKNPGECFGIESTSFCKPCNTVTCPADVTTTTMTPEPTATTSSEVSCQGSTIEVKSGPTAISCKLNDTVFSYLNITSRSSVSNITVIAQIDNTGVSTDLIPTDDITATLNDEIVTISIRSPTCTTGDFYGVDFIVSDIIVGSSEGKLVVRKTPNGYPKLFLHPDQITGLENVRSTSLHSCSGDIGFPAGDIVVEILKEADTDFTLLTMDFMLRNTSLVDSCTYRKEIKFWVKFTSDMKNAVIRCGVKNDFFENFTLKYSNNESVFIIPQEICENNTENIAYFTHPTNCKSFVQCEQERTYGMPCDEGYCFGIESTNYCSTCGSVTCPADVVVTTTPVPIIKDQIFSGIDCNDNTTFIFSEYVELFCYLNETSFEFINITFNPSEGSTTIKVAEISGDRSIMYPADQDLNLHVQFIDTSLKIVLKNVSCYYNGVFDVVVSMTNSSVKDSARLKIQAEPIGLATLMLNADQIADFSGEHTTKVHKCVADVGNPPGNIFVELRLQGGDSFSNITNLKNMGEIDTFSQCTFQREYKFLVGFTSNMDNATVRCKVANNYFPSFTPTISNPEQLALVSGDFCEGKNGTIFSHPTHCKRYVQCAHSMPSVTECQTNCYKQSIQGCTNDCGDYCV